MDSLELKVPPKDLDAHLSEVRHICQRDQTVFRQAKENEAPRAQKSSTAAHSELQAISSRNKIWSKEQTARVVAGTKGAHYTSNKTHYSPTDPDARSSVKPGKARKLNYLSQLIADTGHHVITDIKAYHANKKDSQCLQNIKHRLKKRSISE
jgi:hypothetical protein